MKKGKFIVIEGLDGCGKSTISKLIAKNNNAELLTTLPNEIKHWMGNVEKQKIQKYPSAILRFVMY